MESRDGHELRFKVNYLAGHLLTELLAPPRVVNQIMHAFDLADRGLTANALHPATYMPTKMVIAARGSAVSTLEEGVRATLALVTWTDVSGRYFRGLQEDRADPQAYDTDARRRLREVSEGAISA